MSNRNQATLPAPARASPYSVRGHVLFAFWVIALLGGGIGGWAATAELNGAVIAPGSVVVDRHPQRIQHRDGGIVAAINVKNGDRVVAGQVLIEIDETQIRAELGVLRAELTDLVARNARLGAVIAGRTQIAFPDGFAAASAQAAQASTAEQHLLDDALLQIESRRDQLLLQISQLDEEIAGVEAQRQAKDGQSQLIRQELEEVQQLYDKQLTSVTRLYALQREAERLNGELGGLTAQIARARGKISEINLQILGLDQGSRLEAQRELRAGESRVAELRQREIAAEDRLRRCKMLAPQAGLVHEIAVNTVGGVISPAETVLSIVPSDELLTIEARIAPTDIDQIVIGGVATLRFSSFNQRTTPEVAGRILQLAADTSIDERTSQPYYLAKLEIEPDSLAKLDGVELLPGMPVEVFVSTGSRTALSYMFKPIFDQFNHAFRGE